MDAWKVVGKKGKGQEKPEKPEKSSGIFVIRRNLPGANLAIKLVDKMPTATEKSEKKLAVKEQAKPAPEIATDLVPRPSPKISSAAEKILQQAIERKSLPASSSIETPEQKEKRIAALIADEKKQAMQMMAVKAGKEPQEVKKLTHLV